MKEFETYGENLWQRLQLWQRLLQRTDDIVKLCKKSLVRSQTLLLTEKLASNAGGCRARLAGAAARQTRTQQPICIWWW